jgi:hypothetical protein
MSAAVPHDQQSIEQAKRDRRHDEQIHRRDAVGMVMKKCLPALVMVALVSSPYNARLADIDAELDQAVHGAERLPLGRMPSQYVNLMPKDQDLGFQRGPRSEQ